MKWIIVVIILIIVPYTFLTLRYRKAGPAFQPYEDMKNRANVARLLEAGYRRITIAAQRPADSVPTPGGAPVTPHQGGLPEELRATLVEVPLLPAEISALTAAPVVSTLQPYPIRFTCTLPNEKQQLSGAELFLRGGKIVITPTFEPVGGELQTRSRQADVLLTVAAGTLPAGRYNVVLVATRASLAWSLEVK
jgi:hypothetical protein